MNPAPARRQGTKGEAVQIISPGKLEIEEAHPNENKSYLFRVCRNKGTQPPLFALGKDSKAGRGVRKVYSENRDSFGYTLVRGCWPGEAGGRRIRSGAFCVIDLGNMFSFL